MSTGVDVYSTTPASNGTLGGTAYFPEGQAPSTVNDAARQVMADIAAWVGQAKIPEFLTGTAGTNTITATGPASLAAYTTGQRFFFNPANTNTGATTINITPSGGAALGAKNVFYSGAACAGGEIRQSVPVEVIYDGTQFNVLGTLQAATQAQQETSTTTTAFVTPARQQSHPSAVKAWCQVNTGSTISASYNMTSVTDSGVGDHTFIWNVDFSSTAYVVFAMALTTFGASAATLLIAEEENAGRTVTQANVLIARASDGALADPGTSWMVCALGDQ